MLNPVVIFLCTELWQVLVSLLIWPTWTCRAALLWPAWHWPPWYRCVLPWTTRRSSTVITSSMVHTPTRPAAARTWSVRIASAAARATRLVTVWCLLFPDPKKRERYIDICPHLCTYISTHRPYIAIHLLGHQRIKRFDINRQDLGHIIN